MNDKHEKVLLAFLSPDEGFYDDEAVYFYKHFENRTKMERKELKKLVATLRELDLIIWVKGLISDDGGGYYGSGFMLTTAGQNEARRLYAMVETKES